MSSLLPGTTEYMGSSNQLQKMKEHSPVNMMLAPNVFSPTEDIVQCPNVFGPHNHSVMEIKPRTVSRTGYVIGCLEILCEAGRWVFLKCVNI